MKKKSVIFEDYSLNLIILIQQFS